MHEMPLCAQVRHNGENYGIAVNPSKDSMVSQHLSTKLCFILFDLGGRSPNNAVLLSTTVAAKTCASTRFVGDF